MTASEQSTGPNAREAEYWNSPAARAWSNRHEPIDGLLAGIGQIVLDAAAAAPGEHVLDIGCGSGTTTLALAERVAPGGRVLGVDIAKASVARANERIAAAGLRNAEVILADASTHAFAPNQFDLAFSRLGVMFFTDPTATFARVRATMKPGGRLTAAVFRPPAQNPWATAPVAAVRELVPPTAPPGPEDPGQFSWADPARVNRILGGAGFRDVSLTPHDPPMPIGGSAEEATQLATSVGPVVRAMIGASEEVRAKVRASLLAFFQQQEGPNGVVFPGAIWIVRARV
jgi:SAM-dependent methyltransferase